MKNTSPWIIFILVAIAQFMVVLDSAITNVALPAIQQQLHFTESSLQWVVTAYALGFGGFLLLGGRAADLFGRRRMLVIGITAFTLFSFLIGISQNSLELIILRALQGLAAAFMSPAALSIVLVTFKDGMERNKALGFWSLVATGGAALGLLLGGILTQYLGWRWNFFINVPIGVVMSFLIYRLVPAHEKEEKENGLDVIGSLLVTASLILLVFAVSEAPAWGWLSAKTLFSFAGAIVLLGTFVFNESLAKWPLMPLSIFKLRNVTGANLIMVPVYASMLSVFFLVTLYIQGILHFSPVVTGLAFLPFPVVLGFISTRMPALVGKYGFRRFLIMGPMIVSLGLLWLSRIPLDGNYFIDLLPAFLLIPVGIGMSIMPTIAAATSGVPANEAGLASGLVSTSQQMGGAFGLSILSGVAASAAMAAGSAVTVASTVHGYHIAFFVTIGFMLLAIAAAVLVIKEKKRSSAGAHHSAPSMEMAAVH